MTADILRLYVEALAIGDPLALSDVRGNALAALKNAEKPPERSAPEKACYVGAPAIFALEQACQHINAAFDGYGCYLVGSALKRPDWRDVDVRLIMGDDEFATLFPDAGDHWEFDPRWLLLTVSISRWLKDQTGLPVDFQFQPQTHANERHKGARHALGLVIAHDAERASARDEAGDGAGLK